MNETDRVDGDCIVAGCEKKAAFCGDHPTKIVWAVMRADRCESCNPETLQAIFGTEAAARAWISTHSKPGRLHVERCEVQES